MSSLTKIERRWLIFGLVLIANSAIIFSFKSVVILYLSNVLLHILLGLGALVAFVQLARKAIQGLSSEDDLASKMLGSGAALALVSGLITGLILLAYGATFPYRYVLTSHLVFGAIAVVLCAGYFIRRASVDSNHAPKLVLMRRASAYCTTFFVLLPALLAGVRAAVPPKQTRIDNPRFAPMTAFDEGGGKKGQFFPSSVQTVNDIFFPSEYYTDSKSCGAKGCHPDIYAQWSESAHHFSSFNNQWYRKSIEYMQDVNGVQSSKWCGGCHDMAVLQTEKPGTRQSRMDFPIKDQVWPPEKYPESHSGIGCAACHSIVHVKSTMGQGDFVADYPAMHRYAISKNPLMKWMHNFLIIRAPEPHKSTFLKPFHRNETAKFCSSCHKVHLDIPVNNYRWFRGFNDYDAWQNSGVSGGNARSFYYPKDGYKKCADCHMPLVKSSDKGNKNGFVKSHRFPAANTALPYVNHHDEQFKVVSEFLKNGIITTDVFAIRRRKGGAATTVKGGGTRRKNQPEIRQEASLFASESGMLEGGAGPQTRTDEWEKAVPIDASTTVRPGEIVLIEVVVRTRKVGHFFPGGTVDAFDVWLELEGSDKDGKKTYHSGNLEYPGGPVAKGSHEYGSVMLDAHGNRINKRNAWAARTAAYVRLIPPGAADTAHFRWTVPQDIKGPVTFVAKLNYRKFDWFNTQFAFAGYPVEEPAESLYANAAESDTPHGAKTKNPYRAPLVTKSYDDRKWKFDGETIRVSGNRKEIPNLPIIVVAQAQATIQVGQSPVTNHQSPATTHEATERWNDYGIGLYLQRNFRGAEYAFHRVISMEPKWPEGYVNVARVLHDEGDLEGAISFLKKALAITPDLAKAHYFYGSSLFQLGKDDGALVHLRQVTKQFPEDRIVRDLLGTIYFRRSEFDKAIAEFERTLQIDPEDLQAHYHLMLCYRGKGDLKSSGRHESLYKRFKADESASRIAGPFLQRNPWHNNEARPIHEHEG